MKQTLSILSLLFLFISCSSSDDDNQLDDDSAYHHAIIKTEIIPVMPNPENYALELLIQAESIENDFDLVGIEVDSKEHYDAGNFYQTNSSIRFRFDRDTINPDGYVFETSKKIHSMVLNLAGENRVENVSTDTDLYLINIYADGELKLAETLTLEQGKKYIYHTYIPEF